MAAEDEPAICEICNQGRVTKRMEEMAFRQWSDKGYIHCRVTVLIGTCDHCRVKSLDTTPPTSVMNCNRSKRIQGLTVSNRR